MSREILSSPLVETTTAMLDHMAAQTSVSDQIPHIPTTSKNIQLNTYAPSKHRPTRNGWEFVHNTTISVGFIPNKLYTSYFANKLVPLAHPDNELYLGHDTHHVQGYRELLSKPHASDIVVVAARLAIAQSTEDVNRFTRAIDELGDQLILLDTPNITENEFNDFTEEAVMHWRTLIDIATTQM